MKLIQCMGLNGRLADLLNINIIEHNNSNIDDISYFNV